MVLVVEKRNQKSVSQRLNRYVDLRHLLVNRVNIGGMKEKFFIESLT